MSLTVVNSKEALAEAKAYLNSKEAYITTNGELKYGVNNFIVELVLYNFTRGLIA